MNLDHIRSRTTTNADGCWIWQGALIRGRPYLSVHEDGVRYNRRVQKVVLQLTGTSVPQWVHISQVCGNPLCCAPSHQHLAGLSPLWTHAGNPWAPLLR